MTKRSDVVAVERRPEAWEHSHFASLGRELERVFELSDGTTRYIVSQRDPRAPTWRSATRRKVIPRAPHIVETGAKSSRKSAKGSGGASRAPRSAPAPKPVQASIFDTPNANEAARQPPRSIALPPGKEEKRCPRM